MSFQEYEDLISELEGQNEDLRYRLSFSSSEQDQLSSGLRELMSENEQLVHRVMNLEQALKAERENSISREHSLRRALKEKNIIIEELETGPSSRMSLNSSTSELGDDGEGSKRKLHAAEQDIQARDMLIEELEMTVEDLHKQYHNTRVESDIATYELSENMKLLEEKLAHAEIMSQDEGLKYEELSDKFRALEEMYEGLCERLDEQLVLTDTLGEKLTATEFDLFAAAERLDDVIACVTHDVGTCTEAVSIDIEKLKLTGELERVTEKYENSLYRVSELTMDNTTLESKLCEVENELDNYLNQDSVNSSRGSSSIDHLLIKKEEALHNLTLKLEEFQNEKLKRENELLEKLNELTENKHALCERLEAYEDEIFELSEQIAIIETEKEDTEKDDKLAAISRKLSSLQGLLSVKEDRGESSSGESGKRV